MLQMYKSAAAVDSELAMLHWKKYSLKGPCKNPLNWEVKIPTGVHRERTLMVSRLDGPSRIDVHRMILAARVTEAKGLNGTCYIDAGGPNRVGPAAKAQYDAKLTGLASFLEKNAKMKVVLDTSPSVFAPGTCPDAALYVGWYSLTKYVPAFTWQTGAVGWHVASWEAVHLRDPKSNEWCVKMIQNGVAGTLGAVSEPLLPAFPEPEQFMGLLMTGKLTLAECYWRVIPQASWQMILLGDPLYNPFKTDPKLDPKTLPEGLMP